MANRTTLLLLGLLAVFILASPAHAFGAGNIASVSAIEGHNWRHGDIEDMLKTVACLKGHKWTSMMIKRVYFGNWLRDYSQAVDVGTLKGVQADTIRVLVWVLAFMSFGYATEEFEVTSERLGCYRPEEHIDNPKDYADNKDAREFDQRLRGPVLPIELAVDQDTGMKNYIANERGDWATSAGYIKYSFARSIHFGRLYTHGSQKGREEDLCEALRCLGQGLHCMEDFGAHTNYTELALRELGFNNIFAHVGANSAINLRGKHVFPLVTGTFGGVDFLHSVLGEATDHVTQTEVQQMEDALTQAQGSSGNRGIGDPAAEASGLTDLLAQIPGTGNLIQEAIQLQADSDAFAAQSSRDMGSSYDQSYSTSRADPSSSYQNPSGSSKPLSSFGGANVNVDPKAAIAKIYPLLQFRDKVVRSISAIVAKIPGLEKLVETISERVTLFIMGLLAPYMKPIIAAASNGLKTGSSSVVSASARQQYLVWDDASSTDPTHSMLSKDHFSNILNEPAGGVAAVILQYVAPRVLFAWDHPDVPVQEVLDDVTRIFHHPAIRDNDVEIHRNMFSVVEKWIQNRSDRGSNLNNLLSSESVRAGKNHTVAKFEGLPPVPGTTSHSFTAGGPWALFGQRGLDQDDFQNPQSYPSAYGEQGYQESEPASGYGYSQPPQVGTGFEAQPPQGPPPGQWQGYNEYQGGYGQQPEGGYGQPPPPQQGGGYGQPQYDQYGQQGGYGYR